MSPDSDSRHVAHLLSQVLAGDAHAALRIRSHDHMTLSRAVAEFDAPLVLTRQGVVPILRGLLAGVISDHDAQVWASFVRRGYFANTSCGVRPLDIQFDEAWEESISTVVSRLDELGDIVDGTVTTAETHLLLLLLGEDGVEIDAE